MTNSIEAVAFLRVGDRTRNPGYEMQFQSAMVREFASKNNLNLVTVFDCVGTKKDVIKVLDDIQEYCKKYPTVKYLLITSSDRVSRSSAFFLLWLTKFGQMGVEIKLTNGRGLDTALGRYIEVIAKGFQVD